MSTTTLKQRLAPHEAAILRDALSRHGGRRDRAADELGVERKTLYTKLRKHGLLSAFPAPCGPGSAGRRRKA